FGAAALDLAWVAAGRLDAYWERGLSPWDMAAGIALVREAGGFITDLDGCDDMIKTGGILAGNEDIHREMLRALKDAHKAAAIAGLPGLWARGGGGPGGVPRAAGFFLPPRPCFIVSRGRGADRHGARDRSI